MSEKTQKSIYSVHFLSISTVLGHNQGILYPFGLSSGICSKKFPDVSELACHDRGRAYL